MTPILPPYLTTVSDIYLTTVSYHCILPPYLTPIMEGHRQFVYLHRICHRHRWHFHPSNAHRKTRGTCLPPYLTTVYLTPLFVFQVDGETPRANFDTFPVAALSLFQIMTGEDWTDICFAVLDQDLLGGITIIIWFIFSHFILLQIFAAGAPILSPYLTTYLTPSWQFCWSISR